jgi:ElaB/YqjD/DUF883 family membrane-anchored ribosome-binding protein
MTWLEVTNMADLANTTTRDEFEDAASQVKDRIEDATSQVRDRVEGAVEYFRERGMQDLVDDLTQYVKSHPTQALIGAAVLGFVAGQIIRRS